MKGTVLALPRHKYKIHTSCQRAHEDELDAQPRVCLVAIQDPAIFVDSDDIGDILSFEHSAMIANVALVDIPRNKQTNFKLLVYFSEQVLFYFFFHLFIHRPFLSRFSI